MGTQIDVDIKNEKVAQICVQGGTPFAQNYFDTPLKVEKLTKSLAREGGGNLGNTQKKGCIFWEGFPN